ncbi:hypothetical protein MKO06_10205 [Gramella sp. GC03-9]|uniref:Uncharacterized protein n=1 Tax=Christiangramia oceanisediminis TaxID=2920386 RepID=A0A9X2KXU4_9FLAO|nr:hypothetical protein [Gramella oceanisediminis]MCP9200282.1 hypothetical protein [Gramella oceanisediminis]
MELNEIKKALYKQNPEAILQFIRIKVAYYEASLEDGTKIRFEVPVDDMGSTDFFPTMDSKLLIRWINKENEVEA